MNNKFGSSVLNKLKTLSRQKSKTTFSIVSSGSTAVDSYWGSHTVNSTPFKSRSESLDYLEWRFQQYPMFRELMDLWGDHSGQVVLDYGCGPGNDLTGFLEFSNPCKVIGIDVSQKALALASLRLSLHNFDAQQSQLIKISDASLEIPLENRLVDYIYCEGVLHHTSHPEQIMKEFRRILKPDGQACIMVYNYDSVWLHLYTAYDRMIRQNAFPGLHLLEAFTRNTDGTECPISRCYKPEDFLNLCTVAGFRAEFKGGYLSTTELDSLKTLASQALEDRRLSDEHKIFLKSLNYDKDGYPLFRGKYAGIGGVYSLT